MQQIEHEGNIYYYAKGKFYDTSYIEVDSSIKNKLADKMFLQVNYKELTKDELLEHLKEVKNAEKFHLAKNIGLYGLEKFDEDVIFVRTVLPILTSCYRETLQPKEAIELVKKYRSMKYSSIALLTSVAAAFCDIRDYESAKRFADIAYRMQGGSTGSKNELSLVYMRIKKESGEKDV